MDNEKLYRITLVGIFLLTALAIIGYVSVKVGSRIASEKTVPMSTNDTAIIGTSPSDNTTANQK